MREETPNDPLIDSTLVRHLVAAQFPQWKDLSIRQVVPGGVDNRTFRLGENMLVRMPSALKYMLQVEKEQQWLPKLAPWVSLPIPVPLGLGLPAFGYPWKWSIYSWISGETASSAHISTLSDFATTLAQFLLSLHHIDPTNGPLPGPHSFYRGGELATYDTQIRHAIAILNNTINANAVMEVWETALTTCWKSASVWLHGDVSPGNLLVEEGRLRGVIDFGQLTVGDPACDLAIAWTLFKGESREVFRSLRPLDAGTWARGRAWTLWKALIICAGLTHSNTVEVANSWRIIDEVLLDHRRNAL